MPAHQPKDVLPYVMVRLLRDSIMINTRQKNKESPVAIFTIIKEPLPDRSRDLDSQRGDSRLVIYQREDHPLG